MTPRTKRPAKPSPMKAMHLTEASKRLEGIGFDQTRALTPTERASLYSGIAGPYGIRGAKSE
jgi:hypothetical protein